MKKIESTIEEKIKDFLGLERWNKALEDNASSKGDNREFSSDYIDFLIKKYKCKFPQANEQNKIERIRL